MKNNLIGKKRKWWSWHRQRSKRRQWWALPDLRRMLLVSSRSLLSLLSCTSLLSLACSTSAISASFCAHIASLVQVRRRQHACAHDTHTHIHTHIHTLFCKCHTYHFLISFVLNFFCSSSPNGVTRTHTTYISFSHPFCPQNLLFITSNSIYTHMLLVWL